LKNHRKLYQNARGRVLARAPLFREKKPERRPFHKKGGEGAVVKKPYKWKRKPNSAGPSLNFIRKNKGPSEKRRNSKRIPEEKIRPRDRNLLKIKKKRGRIGKR